MYIIVPSLLSLSWLTIYLSEKRNVFTQWLEPWTKRSKESLLGLSFSIILCFITQICLSVLSGAAWKVSDDISIKKISFSLLYDLNSVLGEELLFRGVILYLLIRCLSPTRGMLISAAAFGIYHWFSFSVFGNLPAMLIVFLVTGLMGYVFASAYEKTKSIALPIGIHLGWNWINNTVYSNGPNGLQILEPDRIMNLNGVSAIIAFGLYLAVILFIFAFVRSKFVEKSEQVNSIGKVRTNEWTKHL